MSILNRTTANDENAGDFPTVRRRFCRRAVWALVIGMGVSLLIVSVQIRSASAARGVGLLAFAGRFAGGSFTPGAGDENWTWLQARSWRGEWVGVVRNDASGRSNMWSARDLAFARLRNERELHQPLPRELADSVTSDLLAKRPWVAGFERLSVGWPLPSLRSTYVWGSTAEMDRVDRSQVVEGWDVASGNPGLLASLIGVSNAGPPESVVPTTVLWPGLIANWLAWTGVALTALSLSGAFRSARGVWWHRHGRCGLCGYPLGDFRNGRCPECGTATWHRRTPLRVGFHTT